MSVALTPTGLPLHFILTGYTDCGFSGVSDPDDLKVVERFDTEGEAWDVEPRCAKPAAYIATGGVPGGHQDDTGLCAEHTAHVRECPSCSYYLSVLRSA